jgi:hypothetical protein
MNRIARLVRVKKRAGCTVKHVSRWVSATAVCDETIASVKNSKVVGLTFARVAEVLHLSLPIFARHTRLI